MTKAISITTAFAMLVAAFFAIAASAFAANSTVVVTGDTASGENEPGWLFNRDANTSTPYEFNTDEASIGDGSLYVLPIDANASDKFIAENFLNTSIADVNSVSYDFLIGDGGEASDANHFYMNVYANFGESDDDKFYDCRYNIVPTTVSTSDWTTVTFDPTESYPVTESDTSPHTCPAIPVDMDNESADSTIRVFALNVGDTSDSDEGLDGYLDNVVVDTEDGVTTYDFEPATTPTDKNECKDGGWENMVDEEGNDFRNQGDCVSYVASDGKSQNNPGRGRGR